MTEIALSHAMLVKLAVRCSYELPDDAIIFFAFRGMLPLDIGGTAFASSHKVRLVDYDHKLMRCTLGQWKPKQGLLAVFPGSTVPNLNAMQLAKPKGGIGANMLMLGQYRYDRGIHKAGKPSGHRAFRQGMFFPVWRNSDDMDYDLRDRLDLSGTDPLNYPWDNLHCAYHDNVDTPGFSSNGCQVVSGRPTMPANGNKPESGPWARFVANAYGADAGGQTRFTYLLFSGAEAGLVAAKPEGPYNRSVRFGSSGEWVKKVQEALRGNGFPFLEADGGFGRETLEALMGFQADEFGPGQADGVVGPNTATALGIDWPAITKTAVAATSALPSGWQATATRITPGFEVAGDPYLGVSGDFDKMGISCGALQWNIGKNSLQPMVRNVGQQIVMAAMPTLGAAMWQACNSDVPTGLATVRQWQTGSKLTNTARTELQGLMGTPQMRAEQDAKIALVAQSAFSMAGEWASSAGRNAPSKLEFLWFFDLVTQNGSLKGLTYAMVKDFIAQSGSGGADDVICDYLASLTGASGHITDANKNAALWRNAGSKLAAELLVLSYLRSGSADPKWRHVVLNRKGTIAMRQGHVNGKKWDFTSDA